MISAIAQEHMSIKVSLFALFVLGIVSVFGGIAAAKHQEKGIDLVLLIDQSGSMGGSKVHPLPNDPYGKRIEAVENAVQTLFDSVEGYYNSYRTSLVHQISIIEFGTDARVAVSVKRIEYKPGEAVRLRRLRIERIGSSLKRDNLGNTDHFKAFMLAKKEIEAMKSAGLPGKRNQVVLMVTDGKPYVRDFSEIGYLHDMRSYIEKDFLQLGRFVEVLGLNDADNYWGRGYGRYWKETTGGNATLIQDDSKFYKSIKQVLEKYVVGIPKVEQTINVVGDDFDCPPYIKLMIINVDKHIPGTTISLTDPDGRPVNLMTLKRIDRRTFSRIYIPQPKPGIWRLHRPGADSCSIEVELYYTSVTLLAPLQPVNPLNQVSIRYRVMSEEGTPFKELPDYPVNAGVEIISPDGSLQSFEMMKDTRGIFKTKLPFVPVSSGDYKLRMIAKALTKAGNEVVVFQSSEDILEVTSKKPIQLLVREPSEGRDHFLRFAKGKVLVRLDLIPLGNPGSMLSIAEVARIPARLIEVSIVDDRGKVLGGPTPLLFDGTSLRGEILVQLSMFSLRWAFRREGHWLRFHTHGKALNDEYYFHSVYRGKLP